MTYLKVGNWTQQEINDFEDCIGMWRFEKKGNRIFVKYPRKETSMTDKEAMAMALDALETEVSIDWTNNHEFVASAEKMHEAIAALNARLAQPQKKVWTFWNLSCGDVADAIKAKIKEKNGG